MKCSITGVPIEFCTCRAHVLRDAESAYIKNSTQRAMTLREARCIFTINLAQLISFIGKHGYECALDSVKVPAESNDGRSAGSLHRIGLAADINLYRGARYLTDSNDHAELGRYWKTLHPLNRWGGDFKPNPDGNHYSMEWEGRK